MSEDFLDGGSCEASSGLLGLGWFPWSNGRCLIELEGADDAVMSVTSNVAAIVMKASFVRAVSQAVFEELGFGVEVLQRGHSLWAPLGEFGCSGSILEMSKGKHLWCSESEQGSIGHLSSSEGGGVDVAANCWFCWRTDLVGLTRAVVMLVD